MESLVASAFGWCADVPDFRDLTPHSEPVQQLLGKLKPARRRRSRIRPSQVDLREYFPVAFDQGTFGTSPANSCVALVEYFERRAYGRHMPLSRMFLHYTATRVAQVEVTAPTCHRAVLNALVLCGVPPERYWPYDGDTFTRIPDAFLYSFRGKFPETLGVRLDLRNQRGGTTLDLVRLFLAAGFPCLLGVSIPSSISREAEIPYRPTFDSVLGGQSLVAVGYDDDWLGSSRGALIIRNCWGSNWGSEGYGWLPYAFVEEQLATDIWTILRADWLIAGDFQRPMLIQ